MTEEKAESLTKSVPKVIPRKQLGEMLIEAKLITAEQLENALKLQRKDGKRLGQVLIEQGVVTPEDMAMMLSLHLNIPFIDLKRHVIQPDALRLIPEETARKHLLIPLGISGDSLLVAMADPGDIQTIGDLQTQLKMRIEPGVGVPTQIQEAIDLNYKMRGEIERQISQIASPVPLPAGVKAEGLSDLIASRPIVCTLDLLIAQAVRDRASDIHIEPREGRLRIRYRIDGILHDMMSLPLSAHSPLMSKVKTLAEMNTAERRYSQNGQFSVEVGGRDIDIRAAICETALGEMAVLRIFDKSLALFTLPELGLLPQALKKYRQMLKSPFGMLLISGPTGSGKTTTLYASVDQLDRNEHNIVTVEDPVEYRFIDINQIQVNPRIGLTLASVLRDIIPLDADVILVGEIRDADTAKTAVQAALTGHLVLSSIHANDAVGVLFRLMELGVEPYLILSALVGIVAQRLVRRVCSHCRAGYQLSMEERMAYEEEMGPEQATFYSGAGCNFCADTGYSGRTGVFEVLPISEGVRRMLLQGASADEIKAQALREGMVPMRHDGMVKVREGITTSYEVLRKVFSIG